MRLRNTLSKSKIPRHLGLFATMAFAAMIPRLVLAQSLTSVSLAGVVHDGLGRPLFDVSITAGDPSTGLERHATTDRVGRFSLSLLPPGQYDVLAEAIGYRPKRMRGVPAFPGTDVNLSIDLEASPPPVDRIDTVSYRGAATNSRGNGMSQRFMVSRSGDFPERTQDVIEQLRHASNSTEEAAEGLPSVERTLVVDGVPFVAARHPFLATGSTQTFAFPSLGADRVEWLSHPSDVELRGEGAGTLVLDTRRGSNNWRADLLGDWAGGAVSSSRYFDPASASHNSWRGGAVMVGPLVHDTANFAVGVTVRRNQTPFAPAVFADSASALVALARDSFQRDLAPYTGVRLSAENGVSGFARVDWQLSANHSLTARANVGTSSISSPELDPGQVSGLSSQLKATDFSAATILTSVLAARISHELRLGVSGSKREYLDGPLPPTLFAAPPLTLAADPDFAGRFQRTEVQISDVLHLRAGAHLLKVGADGSVASIDDAYAPGRAGAFAFSGAAALGQRRGTFEVTAGSLPVARFTLPRFSGMLQDAWSAVPGLRVTLGLRLDYERLPQRKVFTNDSLLVLTGLDNATLPAGISRPSPRIAFQWDAGGRGVTVIRGAAGLYSESVDPGLMSEAITNSGRIELRSAVGSLGSWPSLPDETVAPTRGREISLFGSSLTAPRSGRLTFGLSRALGSSGALHLSGAYRHTDFLSRRHDLNLLPSPAHTDSHGQPIYGDLLQLGGLVAVIPGSNRRFPGFDRIWAIDQDGFSDYRGVTVALERESQRGLRLVASYTYSKTTDNWTSRPGLDLMAQVTPFPAGLAEQDWAEGTSDLDVPHHVSVGIVFPTIPRLGARLGILYAYRSGYPFTPGFRDGVDLNGDGSGSNDPAYVDEAVAGTTDLFSAWPCLASQSGRVASRNSCRGRGVHRMDLRLTLATVHSGRWQGQIMADVLDLFDSENVVPDRALYLIDATKAVTVNPVTGVVTVPLVTNPNFGQPLIRLSSGRGLRLGLRLTR